jgi:three-Cys-motif partner protein
MVALHRPDELPTPPDDGLPVRKIKSHTLNKIHFWGNYFEAASTAIKSAFPARIYYDPFAASGVCEISATAERSYGTGLVALQATVPFDVYFLNDIDPEATAALAERARSIGVQGASVFELDLRAEGALDRARDLGKVVVPWGPKVIVSTGDANQAHWALKEIMPSGWRYLCAVIDPPSAIYEWRALEALTFRERAMDVLTLFPDEMDIGRALDCYFPKDGNDKLDRYFPPGTDWRSAVDASPRQAPSALRALYEDEINRLLQFRIGNPKTISMDGGRALYRLVFASKSDRGIKIWNSICRRSRHEQYELPILIEP